MGVRVCAGAMLVLQVACAALPVLEERLDGQTGVSSRQMGQALEFFSAAPGGPDESAFAYLGALEANRMGNRSLFVWLSVLPPGTEPDPARGVLRLQVIADAKPIELPYLSADPEIAGLSRAPFERPAQWAREGYFGVTVEQLRAMRAAKTLRLSIDDGSGLVREYVLWKEDAGVLHLFIDAL